MYNVSCSRFVLYKTMLSLSAVTTTNHKKLFLLKKAQLPQQKSPKLTNLLATYYGKISQIKSKKILKNSI